MTYKYVPFNATTTSSKKILIDFQYYKDKKCELEKFSKPGKVRKILRFIMKVGRCQDNSELHEYLKGSNVQDMSKDEYFQNFSPFSDSKVYEVWHKRHTPERVLFITIGNTFYPILFLRNHK